MQKSIKPPRERKGRLEKFVKGSVKRVLHARQSYQFWPVQTGYGMAVVDCLACVPITITPDMVGRQVGVFVAIETKAEDTETVTPRQAEIMRSVRQACGVALMINRADDEVVNDKIKWAIRTGYIQSKLSMEG